MLSLSRCPAVGELWYCDKMSHLSCSSEGTDHLLSLTYPSGSLLAPCVLHHSYISIYAVSCATCTWLWIVLGVVMVVLTNSSSWMRVTASLSCSPLSTPGSQDSMSGAAWIFPGTCLKIRLKTCKSENHCATCWLTFYGNFQWSRLAWSVRMVTGISIAAKWGLYFMSGMYTPRNSCL